MSNTKTVFTTGEAAKICKVSQQTIIRCFDNGTLKGFRVPGSRFRRIPRDHLFVFMKDNGIPTDALESGRKKLPSSNTELSIGNPEPAAAAADTTKEKSGKIKVTGDE